MEPVKKAVLLSGGVDSMCLTYGLRPEIAYTIDYGQVVAEREIYVSKYVCDILDIEHKIIKADCRHLGSGNLAGKEMLVQSPSEEWWPFRNQLLITLALMEGIKDGVKELHLASVKSDEFHTDGTSEFYKLINDLVSYQEGNISIKCLTLDYFSHEVALKYKVPLDMLSLAHSCHVSNQACGYCSGCEKQQRFRFELNLL